MTSVKVCQMFSRGSERLFDIETWLTEASFRLSGVSSTHLEPKQALLALIGTVLGDLCLSSLLDQERGLVDYFRFHLSVSEY